MTAIPSDIAFTPAVKEQQALRGSRDSYRKMEQGPGWRTTINQQLEDFIAQRDSIYIATASADGQPYMQHRGGPPGFIKIIDDHTIAIPDYAGNKQYITLGNLTENPKAFIFLMDYPNRRRIKLWGTARFVEDDPQLLQKVTDPDYPTKPDRAFLFTIHAWDINCPKHITPRYTVEQIQALNPSA